MKPLINFIIPAFYVENYVAGGNCSVQAQTLQDLEIVVIGDNSTYDARRIAGEFRTDPLVIPVMNRPSYSGTSGARNAGLGCRGQCIGFLDEEDT
jgi:glycosyltransferase involved in cell wall biosynthesis